MNNLEIETKRESVITGNEGKNILEIENPRESVITGEQTNLTIQKKIKGLIPMVLNVNPETDEVLGFKKLYCIRYED